MLYVTRDVMEVGKDNIFCIVCICGMGGVGKKKHRTSKLGKGYDLKVLSKSVSGLSLSATRLQRTS
ncbi:hypothetical protein LguiB_013785 [Lonicera macranthoides]